MNDFIVKIDGAGAPMAISDVGKVQDSHQIQTNVVHIDGKRQVYIPIYRQPGANTIAVIDGVKNSIAQILKRLPKDVRLDVVLDQSVYVRSAIHSLQWEILLGTGLAGIVIFLFTGTVRATLPILVSVPLSILAAVACLFLSSAARNVWQQWT